MYNFFFSWSFIKNKVPEIQRFETGVYIEFTSKQNIKLDLIFYSTILKVVTPINELIFDFLL